MQAEHQVHQGDHGHHHGPGLPSISLTIAPITLAVMVLTGQVSSQTSFNWLDGSGWPPYSEYTAKHSSLFMAGPGWSFVRIREQCWPEVPLCLVSHSIVNVKYKVEQTIHRRLKNLKILLHLQWIRRFQILGLIPIVQFIRIKNTPEIIEEISHKLFTSSDLNNDFTWALNFVWQRPPKIV